MFVQTSPTRIEKKINYNNHKQLKGNGNEKEKHNQDSELVEVGGGRKKPLPWFHSEREREVE